MSMVAVIFVAMAVTVTVPMSIMGAARVPGAPVICASVRSVTRRVSG